MKHLEAEDLVQAIPDALGVRGEENRIKIARLAFLQPQAMRRIYEIVELLVPKVFVEKWLNRPLRSGATPLELLLEGPDGVERLAAELSKTFRDSTQNVIFPSASDAGGDTEAKAYVLNKLLDARARTEREVDRKIFDPLREDDKPLDAPASRIAKALAEIVNLSDRQSVRALIPMACLDPSRIVRIRAIRVAAGFLGYADVAGTVEAMCNDDDPMVRIAAVETLARFSDRPEIHKRLAAFASDEDKVVRQKVAETLVGRRLAPDVRTSFIALALDPDSGIAAIASGLFERSEIAKHLQEVSQRAAKGLPVRFFDLIAIARTGEIRDDVRRAVFLSRLTETFRGRDISEAFEETVRALAQWRGIVPMEIWRFLAASARYFRSIALERAVLLALSKGDLDGPWPLVRALMRQPVPAGGESVRTELAERATRLADGREERVLDLIQCANDRSLDQRVRAGLLWAIGRLDPSPAREQMIDSMVFDPESERELVRLALHCMTRDHCARRLREMRAWFRDRQDGEMLSFIDSVHGSVDAEGASDVRA